MQDDEEDIVVAERLEGPRVSPADKNRYMTIRLPNGLVALLISIPGDPLEPEVTPMDDDEDAASIADSDKASCSLRVNVGNFSDPPGIPGLNRSIAKMIDKGSVQYPQHDHLKTLLRQLDGTYKVDAQCDATHFEALDIPHDHFHRFLDRFAQMFTRPLMSRRSFTAAWNSVGNFLNKRHRSSMVMDMFMTNIAIPEHPGSKLSDENFNAIGELTDGRLYEEALQFRERHYSAHRMTLCLESKFSLAQMELWVKELFANVPTNGLPADDFSQFNDVDPFDPLRFRRIYRFKSGPRDINMSQTSGIMEAVNQLFPHLELTWVMPSETRNYRSKPQSYLASLLNQMGEGSLLRYLQRKEWCTEIRVKSMILMPDSVHRNSMYSLFKMSMCLTDQGLVNLNQVLDAVFSYINMLRREGPSIRYFNEIQNIQEMKFRLGIKEDTIYGHEKPQLGYPPADFLTAKLLYFEFDPDAINACLDRLTPDRMNVIIYEKAANAERQTYDQWYQSYGTGEEISPDSIEYWRTIEPLPEFHYPMPNNLVANDYTVRSFLNDQPRFPIKIHSDDSFEVWWKPSLQAELHEVTYVNCHWISSLPFESPANMAMLEIFQAILENILHEDTLMADVAGYSHSLWSDYKGIGIELSGLNQKLPLFLQQILKRVAESKSRLTEEMFDAAKLMLADDEFFVINCNVADMIRRSLTRQIYWSKFDIQNALRDMEFHQFLDFVEKYMENFRTTFLVQGNMTRDEAIQTAKSCVDILNVQSRFPGTIPQKVRLVLPRGIRCCRVKSIDDYSRESYVKNIYQFPDHSFKMATMIDFFRLIVGPRSCAEIDNRLFNFEASFGINYYVIGTEETINPPEYTLDIVDGKFEKLRETLRKMFESASEVGILTMKEELTEKKRQESTYQDLSQEVRFNWKRITSGDCQFDRNERQLRLITRMRTAEFRAWLLILTMPVTDRRISKLSVQVDSFNLDISHSNDNHETQNYSLEYLNAEPSTIDESVRDYCITDIEAFKRNLEVIPSDESMT